MLSHTTSFYVQEAQDVPTLRGWVLDACAFQEDSSRVAPGGRAPAVPRPPLARARACLRQTREEGPAPGFCPGRRSRRWRVVGIPATPIEARPAGGWTAAFPRSI